MRRLTLEDEHHDYRKVVRAFVDREVSPHYATWEDRGYVDRQVFRKAIQTGIYGLEIPERWGGPGVRDYRYRVVAAQEFARARATSVFISFTNQDDLILYYLLNLGNEAQLARWMPGLGCGEAIGALAMTEPGAGSDLKGIRTSASRDGDGWILNGQKTFITHGPTADLIIVAAQTPTDGKRKKLSLFLVPADAPGVKRGAPLKKIGLRAQDTGELFFTDVRLEGDSLLGEQGKGMRHITTHLARERLGTSLCAVTDARAVFELTVDYCFTRQAFGQPIGDFQANRFALAELATQLDIAELYLDRQVTEFNDGVLGTVDAAKGKWWTTELQSRVIDRCVQLHGGYGYMMEYPVARAYLDARIQTIYGGTTEIMKEIIGRDIAASRQS